MIVRQPCRKTDYCTKQARPWNGLEKGPSNNNGNSNKMFNLKIFLLSDQPINYLSIKHLALITEKETIKSVLLNY